MHQIVGIRNSGVFGEQNRSWREMKSAVLVVKWQLLAFPWSAEKESFMSDGSLKKLNTFAIQVTLSRALMIDFTCRMIRVTYHFVIKVLFCPLLTSVT